MIKEIKELVDVFFCLLLYRKRISSKTAEIVEGDASLESLENEHLRCLRTKHPANEVVDFCRFIDVPFSAFT